jgi:copper chaperone NosL
MRRRDFVISACGAAFALLFAAACKSKTEARCKHCGMRIDPASPWRTELVGNDGTVIAFDTPRCALQSWRAGTTPAKTIRVQEYYDRQTRDGADVRFIVGGDVLGPMGPDLVPVDPPRASKFIQDHSADRALRLDEVTPQVLSAIGAK